MRRILTPREEMILFQYSGENTKMIAYRLAITEARLAKIREDALTKIRERCDIVEIVSRYVSLKSSGRNYVGLCPFHKEEAPSFSVSPKRGIFHCFGCGESGDVIDFLMRRENWNFETVLRKLTGN